MNSYSIRSWQIRLNFTQVLILLGLTLGSMTAAYFLGFTSGQTIGLESALSITATQAAKLPIIPPIAQDSADSSLAALGHDKINDVYAKLGNTNIKPAEAAKAEVKEDNLASIPVIKNDEIIPFGEVEVPQEKVKVEDPLITLHQENARQDQDTQIDHDVVAALNKDKLEPKEKPAAKPVVETVQKTAPAIQKVPETSNEKWYVQLLASTKVEDATLMVKKLKASGFDGSYTTDRTAKGTIFRVFAGPEKSKMLADRLMQQIKREKFVKAEPFLKKVSEGN